MGEYLEQMERRVGDKVAGLGGGGGGGRRREGEGGGGNGLPKGEVCVKKEGGPDSEEREVFEGDTEITTEERKVLDESDGEEGGEPNEYFDLCDLFSETSLCR